MKEFGKELQNKADENSNLQEDYINKTGSPYWRDRGGLQNISYTTDNLDLIGSIENTSQEVFDLLKKEDIEDENLKKEHFLKNLREIENLITRKQELLKVAMTPEMKHKVFDPLNQDIVLLENKIQGNLGFDKIEEYMADTKKELFRVQKDKSIPPVKKMLEIESLSKEISNLKHKKKDLMVAHPIEYKIFLLNKIKKDLDQKGFAETQTILKYKDSIAHAMQSNEPVFLAGPTGGGKTELAYHTALELTGKEPLVVLCNPQSRESDIFSKQGIRIHKVTKEDIASSIKLIEFALNSANENLNSSGLSEGEKKKIRENIISGVLEKSNIESYAIFGPLIQAMSEGRMVIFDEFNTLEPGLRIALKALYNRKSGDKINITGDGEITIAEGYLFVATANLKDNKKHKQDFRTELADEEKRVFATNTIHVDYLPQIEQQDIFTSYLSESGGLFRLDRNDKEVIKSFFDGVCMTQDLYKREANGEEKLQLLESGLVSQIKSFVITPGSAFGIARSYRNSYLDENNNSQTFLNYINIKILELVSNPQYNEEDRALVAKIFASKGFLQNIDLPPSVKEWVSSFALTDLKSNLSHIVTYREFLQKDEDKVEVTDDERSQAKEKADKIRKSRKVNKKETTETFNQSFDHKETFTLGAHAPENLTDFFKLKANGGLFDYVDGDILTWFDSSYSTKSQGVSSYTLKETKFNSDIKTLAEHEGIMEYYNPIEAFNIFKFHYDKGYFDLNNTWMCVYTKRKNGNWSRFRFFRHSDGKLWVNVSEASGVGQWDTGNIFAFRNA